MTIGGFVMFFAERKPLREMLPKIVLASAAFGMTNVLQKIVFNQTNFVTGYVFFTIGTFIGSLGLLIPSSWRRQIFQQSGGAEPKSRFWYLANRFIAGVGSFLVVFAISRGNPAIVRSSFRSSLRSSIRRRIYDHKMETRVVSRGFQKGCAHCKRTCNFTPDCRASLGRAAWRQWRNERPAMT
jgi:hypothetical protein